MEFRVLGPVEAVHDGAPLSLGGPQQRRVLAAMLAEPGRVLTFDALTDVLWPAGDAPDAARQTLISYISRLRSALGDGWVTTTDAGYAIDTSGAAVDYLRFIDLVDAAKVDTPARQVEALDEALALWRGPVFGELTDEWWARPLTRRLDELRLAALATRVDALSADGWDGRPLAEATALVATYPLHSLFVAQLMRGLHSVGRTEQALLAFQTHRELLAERSGLDPSADLVELDRSIALGSAVLPASSQGRSLRGYVLKDLLGEGAHGRVYRATQPALMREVAIKVIRPEIADDRRFVRRFELEAQLVASVEHPHIVPLYDFWREPGAAYLVFRILRGGSGRELAGQQMSLEQATTVIDQIGGALATAHSNDVVHRDVKPSNVLFDEARQAYLADFGIATAEHTLGDDPRWTNGIPESVTESPYASPEQILGGPVDARSDQFGLASTVWQFLTGEVPGHRSSSPLSTSPDTTSRLPPLRASRPDLPGRLDSVLERATALAPTDRFADVLSFVCAWHEAASLETVRQLPENLTNPFKGLRPFRTIDADDFFGRPRQLDLLDEVVRSNGLTAVVGPSGSGKSSLVLAGLIPRVQARGGMAVVLTPGDNPFAALAAALRDVATTSEADLMSEPSLRMDGGAAAAVQTIRRDLVGSGDVMIVVDQFEELWTITDASDHREFTSALAALAAMDHCRVVVTVRADWFDRPLQDPNIGSLVARATVGIIPMTAGEIREAIVGPVTQLGVQFHPELVGRLVSEAVDQPGTLPLLQFALTRLFERRNGAMIELSAYDEIGGLPGAIAVQADHIFESLARPDRETVRPLFTRLVTAGEGAEDTRRRVRRSELAHIPGHVIDAFVKDRLLTVDRDQQSREPTVEIAHESLLKSWPRLSHWLTHDREWLRELRGLAGASSLWSSTGRQPAELYRGARLAVVSELAESREGALTPDEAAFLSASTEQAEAERNEILERVAAQKRQNRRLRRSLVALAVVLVAALVAGAIAITQRRRADDQATRAREQQALALEQAKLAESRQVEAETQRAAATAAETAAQSAARASALENLVNGSLVLRDSQQDLAALLAIEAYRLNPSGKTKSGLFGSFTRNPGFMGYRHADADAESFGNFVLVGDGSTAWALYGNGRMVMIDIATGTITGPIDGPLAPDLGTKTGAAPVLGVSGDGKYVVQAAAENFDTTQQPAAFRVYDAATGTPVAPSVSFGFSPGSIAMSSDGSLVAIAGGLNADVILYRASDGVLLGSYRAPLPHHDFFVNTANVTFGPDDKIYVGTLGGEVIVLDPTTMAPVATYAGIGGGSDLGIRVSADGTYLIAWGNLHVIRVDLPSGTVAWDVYGIEALAQPGELGFCTVLALDDATGHFYCGDAFGTLREYSTETGTRTPADFGTQVGSTAGIAISPDGSELVAASGNTAAYARWKLDGSGPIQRTVAHDYPNQVLGYDAGSEYLMVSRPSGSPGVLGLDPAVWDPVADTLIDPLDATPLAAWDARPGEVIGAFLDTLPDVFAGTYDVTTHRRTGSINEPIDIADIPQLQADPAHGMLFVNYYGTGEVRRFGLDGNEILPAIQSGPGNNQYAFLTADGSVVVVSSFYGGAATYDTATGEQLGERTHALGRSAVSSKDVGVSSTIDGRLVLFDPKTLEITGTLPSSGGASDLNFSTDGSLLMVKGGDRRATLYDMESGLKLGDSIGGESLLSTSASLRPDGLELAVPDGRSVVLWDLRPQSWIEAACGLAGRNLTHAEWDQYIGDLETYHVTCPQFPGE